jgi:hypothetical protein
MPKEIILYQCEICVKNHKTLDAAISCEAKIQEVPEHKIGDVIKYQEYNTIFGSMDEFEFKIDRIQFIGHTYQYLDKNGNILESYQY